MADISIVVPTYNSSKTISRCLASIRGQASPCAETIVVDRFSEDGTAKLARMGDASVIQTSANRSGARNIGFEQSRGSSVIFIDSDMILPPTLVEECDHGLKDHQALVIPEISLGNGFWAKCRSLERNTYGEAGNLIEAARCFRKSAFSSLGGYNSRLEAAEDWDLHNRARIRGLSIGRVQSRIIHDEGSLDLMTILKKKFFYGRALGEYFRMNSRVGIKQANPLSRMLTPSLKSIPSDPVHGAGILILKSLEFTAAGLGHFKGSLCGKTSSNTRVTILRASV